MIGNNMVKSEAAASVNRIEVDTLQKSYPFAGNDISDFEETFSNGDIVQFSITTMDGVEHIFEGKFSVHIFRKSKS